MVVILQRRIPPLVAALVALTLTVSIAAALDHDLWYRLSFIPMKVFEGEVWRLVTWIFVERSPMGLIFACVTMFWCGGDLWWRWGRRKLTWFLVAVVIGSALVTCAVGLVIGPAWWFPHLGGLGLSSSLVIAWALQFPESRARIYWVLDVGGPPLAYGTAAVIALYAIYFGVVPMLPELIACTGTLLYMIGPDVFRGIRLPRRRRRGRKYGVVDGDRHGGPYGPN